MTTRIVFAAPSTPWPPQGPPAGFDYDRDLSTPSVLSSDTAAFNTGLDKRDRFRGKKRCVVCGEREPLEHCHIVPQAEEDTWETIRDRAYVPQNSKQNGAHEPRNGILMCKNHRDMFENYKYFVRFHQERYYVINFGDIEGMRPYHGKALALDYAHHRAPYPVAFLLHEIRTRGFWPWQGEEVEITSGVYQDWVVRGGYLDDRGHLDHNAPPPPSQPSPPPSQPPLPPPHPPSPYGAASSPDGSFASGFGRKVTLEPPRAIFAQTLAFQRTMPTWRAAVVENESWDGTAADNIQKYLSLNEPS